MAAAFLFRVMRTMLVLGAFLAVVGLCSSQPKMSTVEQEPAEEWCPPCDFFFRRLEENKETGKLSQVVTLQERGEPKSGTGLMLDWATGALDHTCIYLQELYGQKSCELTVSRGAHRIMEDTDRPVFRRMVFEPALGASEARCPCETIERVSIDLSKEHKHSLPVDEGRCAFGHKGGIEYTPSLTGDTPQPAACTFADGTRPQNNGDVWRCMQEANCDITDDWLQFVILRDPRLVVVSTYYFLHAHSEGKVDDDLDAFVARDLPALCEWMAIRDMLFSGILRHQSVAFWYSEALADPLEWHHRFFDLVGLQLPPPAVNAAAKDAAANNLHLTPFHMDAHPGETPRNNTSPRRFQDEVSPETVKLSNDIMRQWLSPVVLAKLGVGPAEEESV